MPLRRGAALLPEYPNIVSFRGPQGGNVEHFGGTPIQDSCGELHNSTFEKGDGMKSEGRTLKERRN